jgi:hypothetical protein
MTEKQQQQASKRHAGFFISEAAGLSPRRIPGMPRPHLIEPTSPPGEPMQLDPALEHEAKVELMSQRYDRGEEIFHPQDARYRVSNTGAEQARSKL